MDRPPLPRFAFRPAPPTLWNQLRSGVSDVASVVPDAILSEPAVQLPNFGAPLVVSDPALVREVLNDRHGRFERDRFMRRLFRRSWGQGLAGVEGESWRRQRHAAAPAFRAQAVDVAAGAFASAAERAATAWPRGEAVDLPPQIARIIADIVFAVLVDARGAVEPEAVAADMPAYVRRIARFGLRDLLPLPEVWHDRLSGIDADPAVRRLRALAHRLASGRSDSARHNDMIALIESVGPAEDNIRGLFPAAIDTTVAGASWTLYLLALRPEWQDRVAEEARACRTGLSLDRLSQTRRVVQETLRLFPPAPFLIRSAAVDGKLGEFRVRRGQPISISIYAMHRHRRHWSDPDDFDPDRFHPENGHHEAYLPFGVGPRMCIAAQFALAEITVVVARLVADLAFAPACQAADLSLQVTTRSRTGLWVTAAPRGA